jgi:CheY-like chemotaxis protein
VKADSAELPTDKTVVVADDDAVTRSLLSGILRRLGFEVVAEVRDGAKAVAAFERHKPGKSCVPRPVPRADCIAGSTNMGRPMSTRVALVTAGTHVVLRTRPSLAQTTHDHVHDSADAVMSFDLSGLSELGADARAE